VKAPKRKGRTTKERILAMLEAYAETCNIVAACKKAGIGRESHYHWLKRHPKYREVFLETKQLAADYLEGVAVDGQHRAGGPGELERLLAQRFQRRERLRLVGIPPPAAGGG
jgi:hypothetical protein